jgi:hypothetical protein
MSRTAFPLIAEDISRFARSLHRELEATGTPPGHLQLLNMLARAAGYRNYQHFRAQHDARARVEQGAAAPAEAVDWRRVEAAARHFDEAGGLVRWPSRESHQVLALWVLWSRLPARAAMTEPELNAVLKASNRFGDHVTLRRAMVEWKLLTRTADNHEYRRVEIPPPADARALIQRVGRGAAF